MSTQIRHFLDSPLTRWYAKHGNISMIGELNEREVKAVEYRIIDPSLSSLEQERVIRGWSRAKVEELTGVPKDTLYKLERGDIHKPSTAG